MRKHLAAHSLEIACNIVANHLDADSDWNEIVSIAVELRYSKEQGEQIAQELGRRR